MKFRWIFLIILALAAAIPARSEESPKVSEERIRQMEERLERLLKESESLRRELEALQKPAAPEETPAAEDLTAVETVTPPAPPGETPPADAQAPEEPPIEVMNNQPNPGASKIFNPDIGIIGNFIGRIGDENPVEERPSMTLDEAELSLQAAVDPFALAKFFVGITPEGAELEEGFISFIALPSDFTARVGKMKASFGKVNLMHGHVWRWIDQPLVIGNFFGEEGLNDSGISVARIFPNRWNLFVEATGEIFSGHVDDVFQPRNLNDLFYLGHLKAYRDLTENSNIELGGSFARGTTAETGGSNQFAGLDFTYRYKPLERSIYRSLISRTELIANRRDDVDENAVGFYTALDYQFARRWFAGVRLDRADHPDDPSQYDRGASLTLTFWPSEYSQLRTQARRTRYGSGPDVNELLFQLQFAIGAHGAHTF